MTCCQKSIKALLLIGRPTDAEFQKSSERSASILWYFRRQIKLATDIDDPQIVGQMKFMTFRLHVLDTVHLLEMFPVSQYPPHQQNNSANI